MLCDFGSDCGCDDAVFVVVLRLHKLLWLPRQSKHRKHLSLKSLHLPLANSFRSPHVISQDLIKARQPSPPDDSRKLGRSPSCSSTRIFYLTNIFQGKICRIFQSLRVVKGNKPIMPCQSVGLRPYLGSAFDGLKSEEILILMLFVRNIAAIRRPLQGYSNQARSLMPRRLG